MRDRFKSLGKSIPRRDPNDIQRTHRDILQRFNNDYKADTRRDKEVEPWGSQSWEENQA